MLHQRRRRGAAFVVVVLSIFVFLFMVAFSVDVAYMQLSRMEIRAAADAAAKAGTEAMVREESVTAAIAAAKKAAAMNSVGPGVLNLSDSDVQLGRSLQDSDGSWAFAQGEQPHNSVRILANSEVPLFWGGITGKGTFNPNVQSTATFADNEVCLVVDRSHSMCFDLTGTTWSYPLATPTTPDPIAYPPDPVESRWATLQLAINEFNSILEQRTSGKRVGLVTFGSDIDLNTYEGNLTGRTFPAVAVDVPLTSDVSLIDAAIQARTDDIMLGGTNLTAGINQGVQMLTDANARTFAEKTMIVMTDGKWNEGGNPVTASLQARVSGITVHTVTFLSNADQTDMIWVATVGGGQHYHADNKAALIAAFRDLALNLPITLVE